MNPVMSEARGMLVKSRWFRFSLRTLLIATAAMGVILGFVGNEANRLRRHRRAAARIHELGGRFIDMPFREAWGPRWFPVIRDSLYADSEGVWFTSTRNANLQDADLQVLQDLPRLQFIEIVASGITDEGLRHLQRLPLLRRIVLQDTQVTSVGLGHLRHSPLQELVLGGEALTDETLKCLDSLPTLKKLALYNTSVTDAGLANLKHVPSLEHLYIDKSPITDEGMRHLAGLTGLRRLELMNLNVGDAGVGHLRGLKQLEFIDLEGLKVTDHNMPVLAELPWVRYLNVAQTQVTPHGLRVFERSGILRSLTLGPNIPPEDLQELQSWLPACKVSDSSNSIRFHGP